jgi:hypothetical protein
MALPKGALFCVWIRVSGEANKLYSRISLRSIGGL